jgi:hypothetical protein
MTTASTPQKMVSVRMALDLYHEIRELGEKENRSVSQQITYMLKRWLRDHPNP